MKSKLTPKQKAFAIKYVECGNASEAYRTAYDVKEGTKIETIKNDAYKLTIHHDIAATVIELQEEARERTLVTVESLMLELDENRKMAQELGQPAAANGSTMGKAKLAGLDIHKVDFVNPLTVTIAKEDNKL